MQIIKTMQFPKPPTAREINYLSDLAEAVIGTDECIPSFTINDVPGYDIFWLRDHYGDAKDWYKIQLITYNKAELDTLKP